MSGIPGALQRPRLILTAVVLLSLIGLIAWLSMNRQEDPFAPHRYGDILIPWPGADPSQVERLVLNVLEEEIAQVGDVKAMDSLARLGFARIRLEMHEHVYDTDAVWDRIRVAAERARRKFPEGAGPIEIRDQSMDSTGIVLALTGSDDLLVLLDAARQLRRDLFRISDIARVEFIADPGEQLTILLDPARAAQFGVAPSDLAGQLAARNLTLPAGSLIAGERSLTLRPATEFRSLAELAATPIRTDSGALIPLRELAEATLSPVEPATERLWVDDRPAVALGIVIPDDRLDAVRFGRVVRQLIDELRPAYAPLNIEEVHYQPAWVERRLAELGYSLMLGVLVVALVLLALMGLRMGLVVAAILPLATFSGLAVFAMGGGVLHQMSVAGMVIALGMLVDNAIVMVENLQWHLDRGRARLEAAALAVRELAGPLATATGTTVAAFVPLLLAPGNTADFTRAIPVIVIAILTISYVYAIFVTPLAGLYALRPGVARTTNRFERLGGWIGATVVRRPGWAIALTLLAVVLALSLRGQLKIDFFPDTDRNQFIVDLSFPEGTRVEGSALQASALADVLAGLPGVIGTNHIVGTSGPRFYYNLIEMPRAPHLARIVVFTESADDLPGLLRWVRAHAPDTVPEAQVVARRLGQGPPVVAPVEIRLYGDDPAALALAADRAMATLRTTPGAADVRHRMGEGVPVLAFEIDDAEAARHGLSRREIAETLAGASRGWPISTWRAGREPAPMLLRAPEGERLSPDALAGLHVVAPSGERLPLALFVRERLEFQAASIEHRNLQRMTSVLAETRDGYTYNQVLKTFARRFDVGELPDGVRLEIGGTAASAGTANSALFRTLPIGAILLLSFLLWQFDSFRLVAIVLVSVPLAAAGVIPGMILAGQVFGFTAILGVVALVGIVVNNAIVLIDVMESHRASGASLDEAVTAAVARRLRPIVLTTATTVVGLFPLTLTESTMWPPMAWAIISGLLVSSALTLVAVPALYRILMAFEWRHTLAREAAR